MKLSILIVNYNTESFICQLLASLKNQTLSQSLFEIIIVNNVQNDVMDNLLKSKGFYESFNLSLYQSQSNLGFGRAMNLGFKHAKGEHILLLNPDILMRQDDYLEKLLLTADDNPDYGAISTQVLDDDGNDTSTYTAYEFGQNLGFDGQICWFQGSLLLVRRDVFLQLGGFDPDFFMYCEDVDLCLRIKRLGLALIKNDKLEVYHFGGASEPAQNYDFYHRYHKSQLLFAYKHYDNHIFNDIVMRLYKKTKNRLIYYKLLSRLSKRYARHFNKNKSMFDLTKQVINHRMDYLFYQQNNKG
ncbi:MAG: glycosyltransferase family 2 protein [Moraxella sp.]|nr:glycosyltransferase family 2 protein [Moraxella sp.]